MTLLDLKKSLDEWGLIIKKTSKFTDSDRSVYKQLMELVNNGMKLGVKEIPDEKFAEIAQFSTLNFRESPPSVEEDKENAQLYRTDLLNYLAKHVDEIFSPGHRIYEAFAKYVNKINEREHTSKFSLKPTRDSKHLDIFEEQLKDDLYQFLTREVGYSIGVMTRTVFDDIVTDRWADYINMVRETININAQEQYVKDIISSTADAKSLNKALKEINWKTSKDGMLSYARAFNVVKTLQGNHSDDCFWVMYGAIGGEGKSVYTNGELRHFINKKLSVYVGDNKCFGEHFNSPEPFRAKLLYVREDESWSPEQIRFKKQLVDHDHIGIEQKGKDAYRITPECMVTSMTNYRSYDISRRFAIIDYGRNRVGVDVESLEDFVMVEKYANVSEVLYSNLFNKKDPEYVKNVCVKICKSVQHLNKREDKQWAYNVALKIIQSAILDKDPDLVNLDQPDYIVMRTLLQKALARYKKSQDESKIMSNEFYKNNVSEAIRTMIANGELSEDVFMGTTADFNQIVGKEPPEHSHEAIVIKNKRSVWTAIENYFKTNTRSVDKHEEEARFDKYMFYMNKLVQNGKILDLNIEQIAQIIDCRYPIPENEPEEPAPVIEETKKEDPQDVQKPETKQPSVEDVEKAFKDIDVGDESPKFLKRIWVNNFGEGKFPVLKQSELGDERFVPLYKLLLRLSDEGVVVNDNQ